ncbi:hydantoinase/oxoprolinase family protein [Aurantivibrio plasticivorans]
MLLGVDTGGTFTDFVLYRGGNVEIHKVLSTPEAPEKAILQGIQELNLLASISRGELTVIHGSTVATNAALEGKGVRTVFITNTGFKDMLTIGRQTRRELYNLQPVPTSPPVAKELCLEVDCRRDKHGDSLQSLTEESLQALTNQVDSLKPDAIAINMLFSYINGDDERTIAKALDDTYFVSCSSEILPEYKEYERGIATWLNSYLGPLMERYLSRLATAIEPSPLTIMQSSGGTISAQQASQRAVNLLLSGPAGGLAAAKFVRDLCSKEDLLTFDMGGTSTDVALIQGELNITNEGRIGPYPVAVPMVDMHTIGAGGGSLASVDQGGLLHVGPESAGASPGPACYGQGGKQVTVTDANAILGRLRPDNFLGGAIHLDLNAANQAMDVLAGALGVDRYEAASGVLAIANEHMARALRVISVQRGYDPMHFRLCCFGGAGGLHVCALAEQLNMRKALVPQFGGVLSALGMLVAPRERQLSQTHQAPLAELKDDDITQALNKLATSGRNELLAEGVNRQDIQQQPSLDLRYVGQSYTIAIPYTTLRQSESDFHQRHAELYGHCLDEPIEVVNLRQRIYSPANNLALPQLGERPTDKPLKQDLVELFGLGNVPVVNRAELYKNDRLKGPLLICETVSTTLVAESWQVDVDAYGNLLLEKYI